MEKLPTTIFRPAVVVGDSRTGETSKFDGPYYLLRMISLAERLHLPVPYVGKGSAPANIVPVDFVVRAILKAGRDEAAIGSTLHLADPDPLTADEAMRLLARAYRGREPTFRTPAAVAGGMLRLRPLARTLAGMPRQAVVYLSHPVRFDTRQAEELLERHAVRCPRLPDYVEPLVEFFRRHEDDPSLA